MHPDLPYEQAYFDRALALRDRQQADLARAPSLAANPRAAVELRRKVSRLGLADPDQAIAFGRIETKDDRWYIGKGAIWDDDNNLVVVNWQAPIAAAFYTATPEDPEGLEARRLYRCTGNQIREIEDLMFREVQRAIADGRTPEPVLSDALLDALGSARSGELGDIVATIQAAQYDVISEPLEQLLVVQGGPGTGKTVVGLHRVSWLLFNRRDRLEARDVLIVGPNPAFVHYISSVLPSLGDQAVVQLPLRALGPHVRIGRVDPPDVRRLKGDRRLLRLILRGLRNRQRVEAVPVPLTIAGRTIELDGRRIATRARQLAGRPHNEGYRMLRAFLVGEARSALAASGAGDVDVRGEAARDIDNYLARVWPNLTPQAFLVELLSSRRQLLAAGAGTLSDAELGILALPSDAQVSTWQWSADDVPLLDAADALLNGVPATYEHIVVDEAQDLSPMQLESIRRRSRAGSITVLGDLAQGTSPWAHHSWGDVVAVLRHERVTARTVELEYGYRLPAEVHEVAMRLLPDAAPGLACPEALRSSGHEVEVRRAADAGGLPDAAVAAVRGLLGDGIVGVIVAAALRSSLTRAFDVAGVAWASELRPSAEPVVVLTPDEAKGLEFDVVVVVEPAAIVDEAEHGVRSLFVAMTRCTSRLALVHARPLPPALGFDRPDDGDDAVPVVDVTAQGAVGAAAAAAHPGADDAGDATAPGAESGGAGPVGAVGEVPDDDGDPGVTGLAGGPALASADADGAGAAITGDDAATRDTAAVTRDVDASAAVRADAPADDRAAAGGDATADDTGVVASGDTGSDAAAALASDDAPGTPAVARANGHAVGASGGEAVEAAAAGSANGYAVEPARVRDPVSAGAPADAPAHADQGGSAVVTAPAAEPVAAPASADAAAIAALGDLDADIARAIAEAVAAKLRRAVTAELLPLVARELARRLGPGAPASPARGPRETNGTPIT